MEWPERLRAKLIMFFIESEIFLSGRNSVGTWKLDLNLRGHVLESLPPNIERSLVRIFHLLAYQINGIVKNRIRDTLLPLQHEIVHETCNLRVVILGIRK